MTNGTLRILTGVIFLVAGFAAGFFYPRASRKGDQIIRVNPDGSVSKPQVIIGDEDHVAWITSGGKIAIVFHAKDFPDKVTPPFNAMVHQGQDWIVKCDDTTSTCYPGDVTKTLPQGIKLPFPYDQSIAGVRADGMIIIER